MRARWLCAAALIVSACGDGADGRDGGGVDAAIEQDGGGVCGRNADCDDGVFCSGVEVCIDARCEDGEPPCVDTTHVCIEARAECAPVDCEGPSAGDVDGDGRRSIACGGDDCADGDPNRFPSNAEVCDLEDHDEDCDPSTYGIRDNDRDGEPDDECCNEGNCGTDCDDMRAGVNPLVPEVCGNEIDDDCDTNVDEAVALGFVDSDFDGWGDDARPVTVCSISPGFTERGGDCNDEDRDIRPEASEVCNHADEDCDVLLDDGADEPSCTVAYDVNECRFTCSGSCDWDSRLGYLRMGGTAAVPDAPPGAAYFYDPPPGPLGFMDIGYSMITTTTWSVQANTTPDASTSGHFGTVLTPRPEAGPETSSDFPFVSGVPALMDDEIAIYAIVDASRGEVGLLIYSRLGGPLTPSRVLMYSTEALSGVCRPRTALARNYEVALAIDGPRVTATLSAPGCLGGESVSVTHEDPEIWDAIYGLGEGYPQYVAGALADSDGTGIAADLRHLEIVRNTSADRGHCVACPDWVCL